MKTMKTTLALLMAVLLLSGIAATACAQGEPLGHTYEAYQIFSGKNSTNPDPNATDPVLVDIDWGTGVDGAALLTALIGNSDFNPATPFDANTSAREIAEYLSQQQDDDAVMLAFGRLAYQYRIVGAGIPCENNVTPVDAGYYLVVDASDLDSNPTHSAYNTALLQMTQKGPFTIALKTSVPTLEKKVKDKNDSTDSDYSGWQDSADHDVNDIVPFQVTVELGSLKYFKTYTLVLHDTLSSGLTLIQGDSNYPVTLECVQGQSRSAITNYTLSAVGTDITVTCKDVKPYTTEGVTNKIVLTYYARLNENCIIGSAGNPNDVYLEYSNNPNVPDYLPDSSSPDGYSPNPDKPQSASYGQTPPDRVIVFTYKVTVNKVDSNNQPLKGAKFELFKEVPNPDPNSTEKLYESLGEIDGTDATVFTWERIDDGNYKLVEKDAPAGYNKLEDVFFTVSADHDVDDQQTNHPNNPMLISLSGNTTSGTVTFTGTESSGTVSSSVVNQSGVVLPETGEEGTRMLYILGSVLLLGGLVLIVTRKRVSGQF